VADNETLFLFAAHNLRLKGLRPLLQALAALRAGHARVRLAVIGGSPGHADAQLVSRLAVGSAVHFAGLAADPRPYYAAADAFVLPTFHDACSLTVLEACASGLPAITTQCNGVADLMASGKDGFVISEATAVDELVSAMTICLDPGTRERVGHAARALAVRCSMDRHVDAIEALYRECIARRDAGRRA
jgi:UDP-glucose:(heptosyl)LPS alpha-1,3-glucosyltransferase